MLTYLVIGLWISSTLGTPIHQQRSSPLVYYTPAGTQAVQSSLYPFVQYPNESPAFGKALQSGLSQNEILFYPNIPHEVQQPIVVQAPPGNVPVSQFTAPPSGLVDAIYAWFAENKVPLPDDPSKNEASPEKIRDQPKPDNSDKTAGEAEVLAEADRRPTLHYPKKPVSPKFAPGQRFYILNGQPQFVSNYQPLISRYQPVTPQLYTRNAIPETQNYLILQQEFQKQNIPIKKQAQEPSNQNMVLLQNQVQREIKPVQYSGELKPQNYVFVRENQQREIPTQQIQVQPLVPNYSRQQVVFGRLLPPNQEIKQQQVQTPVHQTHYLPVEVVPPQVPQFTAQLYQHQDQQQTAQLYHQDQPQHTSQLYHHQEEIQQQPQLAFIHIPVDRNIKPPQYIKPQPIPSIRPQSPGKQILYITPETQNVVPQKVENRFQQEDKQSGESNEDLAPGIAALEFARYIASRQEDLYSDAVVVDAKREEDKKEEEKDDSEEVVADEPQEPSIAQAQPGGIALAGPGGVAATAPRGTALVGDKGLAVSSPHATAVAGPNPDKQEKEKKS